MKIYNKIQKSSETRIQEVAEIISELRDPLYSTQTQHMQQQPPQQQQQQQLQLETIQEEDEGMDITLEEMTEKEREEELKRTQAEAKRNEENLRKKRVRGPLTYHTTKARFKIQLQLYALTVCCC